jgi:hypothetical protein
MMLVGWFSDLPASPKLAMAGRIAQETISYHYVSEKLPKTDKPAITEYLSKQN